MSVMKAWKALVSGFAGTAVLTGIHQVLKKIVPGAPKVDELGMQAISKVTGKKPFGRSKKELYWLSMAGDFLFNTFYYSMVATGKRPLINGSLLGLASGVGTVTLPQPLGLDPRKTSRTPATRLMAFSIYLIGGIVAGSAYKWLES